MKNENTSEFVFTNDYRLLRKTTMENLEMFISSGYCAILQFGDKVIVTDVNYRGGYIAAIYKFDRSEDAYERSFIESDITFQKASEQTFEDGGHAVAWALKHLD